MVMLAKIRRMHFLDGLPLREISKRTGLSRNTLRRWLRSGQSEPVYPKRRSPFMPDPYRQSLETWLRADSHRPRRDQRTAKVLFAQLQAQGYPGTYTRVTAFIRQWKANGGATARAAFVPLLFPPGEAFQFELETVSETLQTTKGPEEPPSIAACRPICMCPNTSLRSSRPSTRRFPRLHPVVKFTGAQRSSRRSPCSTHTCCLCLVSTAVVAPRPLS